MSRGQGNSVETAFVGMMVGIALAVIVIVVVLIVQLIWWTATELFRIYQARATSGAQTARYLWGALAGLIGLFVFAGLVTVTTHEPTMGLMLASWGFLAYVLTCEYIDWQARRNDPPPQELSLSDVASWQPEESL